MEARDVLRLPWKPVNDWSNLTTSYISKTFILGTICFVMENDVDAFVKNIVHDIARSAEISYEELFAIFKQQNHSFFSLKNKIFANSMRYTKSDEVLVGLEQVLRVPDISVLQKDEFNECLRLFNSLSEFHKLLFFEKIGKVRLIYDDER